MPDHIAAIDVVLEPMPVISVSALGVQGPPGAQGPAGPQGPPGEPGEDGTDASGDVTGPASATDNAIALFNGTSGKLLDAGPNGTISGSLAIGSNPATEGALRLHNGGHVMARNGANNADVSLLLLDGANHLQLKETLVVNPGGTLYPVTDNTQDLGWSGGRFKAAHVAQSVAIGSTPAQSGALRLGNSGNLMSRNAANSADQILLGTWSDDKIYVGNPSGSGIFDAGMVLRSATHVEMTAPMLLIERGIPALPAANTAYVFLEDNGAGKSRLMIQFATGAAVQIAIQP